MYKKLIKAKKAVKAAKMESEGRVYSSEVDEEDLDKCIWEDEVDDKTQFFVLVMPFQAIHFYFFY